MVRKAEVRQAGFTLLEVIVALVVLGFLMVGLTEGSRFGFTAWKHQGDTISDHDQFDAIDRTLRLLLTQAQLRGGSTQDDLLFTGSLPASVALGTNRADMELKIDEDHRLLLKWTPKRHETELGPPKEPTATVLMSNVGRLTIGYWQAGNASDNNGNAPPGNAPKPPAPQPENDVQTGWNDQPTAGETPRLIKLTLSFPPSDRRHWPPIVVSPTALGPGEQDQSGQ